MLQKIRWSGGGGVTPVAQMYRPMLVQYWPTMAYDKGDGSSPNPPLPHKYALTIESKEKKKQHSRMH